MSSSDQNLTSHRVAQEDEEVDERLSKLSLIARNVTLRLSTTTTRRNISKKVAGETNPKDLLKHSKKVANAKPANKIRDADLRSTNADLTKMTKESEATGNKTVCSEISIKSKKETKSSLKTETSNSETNFMTEQLSTAQEMGEQSEECPIEMVENQVKCLDFQREVEPTAHNCSKRSPNTQTNNTRTSPLTKRLTTEKNSPKKSHETTKKCSSPKQIWASRKISGQTSGGKPSISFGAVGRRKSMKLGERSLIRKKSFLMKGDGLSARRQLAKQMKTRDSWGGEAMESSAEKQVDDGEQTLLCMPGKMDKTNSTFLLTRRKKLLNNATACEGSETAKSSARLRRQWSENSVQTYEALIFSSVFAFSEELRESSDIIHSKLQALYDSTHKTNSIFTKKSSGLTKEWRQNNRELLSSGNQEIAGIFSNLRKVESNLKTVDQAVSILLKEKPRSKERISGSPAKSKVIPAFGQTDWEENLSSK